MTDTSPDVRAHILHAMQQVLTELMRTHRPDYTCGCAVVPCAQCDTPYPCHTLQVVRAHLRRYWSDDAAATQAAQSTLTPRTH